MSDNGDGANDSIIDPGPRKEPRRGMILRPGQLGPAPAKALRIQQAFQTFKAQYQTLYNTMEMIRRPVVQFLLETKMVEPNSKLPMGEDLLAVLRKAAAGAREGAAPDAPRSY